ncbi:hypothetical protein DTW90_13995 [Neorhizobium sp. P12A]|jgi:hypothetical protein|nr:hypothetical protein DTW90_13995 [Neorhizobium sp. P12A]
MISNRMSGCERSGAGDEKTVLDNEYRVNPLPIKVISGKGLLYPAEQRTLRSSEPTFCGRLRFGSMGRFRPNLKGLAMLGPVRQLHQKLAGHSIIGVFFGAGRRADRRTAMNCEIQSLSVMRFKHYGQGMGSDNDLLRIMRAQP